MLKMVFNVKLYPFQIDRIARIAFETAQKRQGKLCSVDKANVLEVLLIGRTVFSFPLCDTKDMLLWL